MAPAVDSRAKVLSIALAAILSLCAPPVLSESDTAIDSSRATKTGSADPQTPAWDRTLRLVRQAFPDVPQMSIQQFATMRTDDTAPDIVLLDARSSTEFKVSHLPGAVLASNTRMALEALEASDPIPTIVVYCSVGYRSSHWPRSYGRAASRTSSTLKDPCSSGPTRDARSIAARSACTKRIHTMRNGANCSTGGSGRLSRRGRAN